MLQEKNQGCERVSAEAEQVVVAKADHGFWPPTHTSAATFTLESLGEPPDSEQNSVQKSLRPWRTARNVNIHGQHLVGASQRRIVRTEDTATDAARADSDDYLGIRHCLIRLQKCEFHIAADRTGYQQHVSMTGGCNKLDSKAFDVVDGIIQRNNLQFASVA